MRGLLDWKIGWLFTFDNASGVLTSGMIHLDRVGTIRDQRPLMSNRRKAVDGSASNTRRAVDNPLAVLMGKWTWLYDQDGCTICFHCSELLLQISYLF